jgi:crossover junction endodeoxyribonuclease RuvC
LWQEQKSGGKMRVIGIDPGLRNLGWGVIDVAGSRLSHVANGICHSDGADGDAGAAAVEPAFAIDRSFARGSPRKRRVEHTFVNKDAVATLKLGQARGVALLVPAQFGLASGNMLRTR